MTAQVGPGPRATDEAAAAAVGGTATPGVADGAAGTGTITVDASAVQGVVQPAVVGQMAEWAFDEMNGAWAERVRDRSFETETVDARASSLYDSFRGTSLDLSRWTPTSLDGAAAGTVTVSGSTVTLTTAEPGQWGLLSRNLGETRFSTTTVEARISAQSGQGAVLCVYGGTGAGDTSAAVELAIEDGVLTVRADGLADWTGGAATVPATLRVAVSGLDGAARDLAFSCDGEVVHQVTGYTGLPEDLRVFLYNRSGTLGVDSVTVEHDDVYDAFGGTELSDRWALTLLQGTDAGSCSVADGAVEIVGGADSRSVLLSEPIDNSAVDWTRIETRLLSVSGTNGLMSVYGGDGAGDFTRFMEFGVDGGVAKVFAPDGYSWTGAEVSLPATLGVEVSPFYANGRTYRFFVDGAQVHELADRRDVPQADYRLGLYGWSTSVTRWDEVTVAQTHMWDKFAPTFDGGPGLSVEWTPVSLAGGWGSAAQGDGQLTVTGVADSRYGVLSQRLEESDASAYTVQARLDSVDGLNGLLSIYAGSGRDDFGSFVEFGVQDGVLMVFGNGLPTWTGEAVTLPATLRVEVSAWQDGGRDLAFFLGSRLVHELEGVSVVGDQEYRVFLYGYGATTTRWGYATWWKDASWTRDGYADRADYRHVTDARNGGYAERVTVTQHTDGRAGLAQHGIAVSADKEYAFSVWLKQTDVTAPVQVLLGTATGDGPDYAAYASAEITGVTGDWAKYAVTLTPTTSDPGAKLFIGLAGTGALTVDLVSLMPTDPSEVVHGGWRADVVERVAALAPVSIRWPGGIISDWYDWTDGVGDRDDRPPKFFAQWDAAWMTNDVGTDEILTLAEGLGLSVVLNVNWGTGTAEHAADWVEYVNGSADSTQGARRAANGRTEPWGVTRWEIGNEVWGWWTPGWTADASAFATGYLAFRDAMVAKDPRIELLGEGFDGNTADQAWNVTLIETADGAIDRLAVHYYSPQTLPQDYVSDDVYRASVASAVTIGDRLAATGDTVLAGSQNDIKLAVMEHAAMYSNEENRRTRTLEGGLAEAGILNLLVRRCDLNDLNAASTLANFWDGSVIRIGTRGTFVTPSYLVQELVAHQHGELLVSSASTSPTYTAPEMGNLPERADVPFLDVTTTRAADGSMLYVSVLNRDLSPVTTTIDLAGTGTIGSTATARTVTSASHLDQNSWQQPTLVQTSTADLTGVGASFDHEFPAHSFTVLSIEVDAAPVVLPAVTGRVTDADGTAVAGATVAVSGGGSTTTDADGRFLVAEVPAGQRTVTVTASGYQTCTRSQVKVSATGATTLPIRLVASAGS